MEKLIRNCRLNNKKQKKPQELCKSVKDLTDVHVNRTKCSGEKMSDHVSDLNKQEHVLRKKKKKKEISV